MLPDKTKFTLSDVIPLYFSNPNKLLFGERREEERTE
jgi:hypothetical protein